jgi:4,5:9,10-diseco-3-hydroxy-5,9,17-trioxoandrosta-1(10),2-diene-4-oate hydrolase
MWPAGEPSIRTRYVTLGGGNRVRVVESGNPAGPAILMVHGWGACVYSYSEMMPALADAGYRAVALDLPGLGLSDRPDSADTYTTQALSSAVVDAATHLGLERFTFVGHSMGGAIGLRLVLDGERRIDRLVLVNSIGLGRAPLMGPVRLLSPRIVEPILPLFVRRLTLKLILEMAFGLPGRPTRRDVDEYWAPTQFREMLRACRLMAHNFDFDALSDAALAKVNVPVLAIGSGRDRMVHGCAERAQLIPNARRLTLDGAGHLAVQECADRVNRAILDFLGETPLK